MPGFDSKLWVSKAPAFKDFPFCHHRVEPDRKTVRQWKGHLAKHTGLLLLLLADERMSDEGKSNKRKNRAEVRA